MFWWQHSRCDSDSGTKPAVPPVPEPSLPSHGLPVTAAGAAAQTSSRQSPAPCLQHQGCPLQPLVGMSWGKERPSPWSGTVGCVVPGSWATLVLSSRCNWGRGIFARCGPMALPAAAAEQPAVPGAHVCHEHLQAVTKPSAAQTDVSWRVSAATESVGGHRAWHRQGGTAGASPGHPPAMLGTAALCRLQLASAWQSGSTLG